MGFFGFISALLTLISLAFFVPVMLQYLQTGLVNKLPTLVVCGFTMIAAIQSFFAGMQLQIMVQKNRQDFELELYRVMKEYREAGGGKHPETPEHKEHEEDAGT
jgi:hypothetical protein